MCWRRQSTRAAGVIAGCRSCLGSVGLASHCRIASSTSGPTITLVPRPWYIVTVDIAAVTPVSLLASAMATVGVNGCVFRSALRLGSATLTDDASGERRQVGIKLGCADADAKGR